MANAALFSPERLARQPILSPSIASITALPTAAPAGGTGATAGGYDTAPHRDDWISLINNERGIVSGIRAGAIDAGLVGTVGAFASSAWFSDAAMQQRAVPSFSVGASAIEAAAPAGGTGADAGGWDLAANRNLGIAAINGVRTCLAEITDMLEDAGIVGTGTPAASVAQFSPGWQAGQPPLPATITAITAVPAAAPAGGTGAAAGCYDTANNRDAAITTTNTLRTIIGEIVAGTL